MFYPSIKAKKKKKQSLTQNYSQLFKNTLEHPFVHITHSPISLSDICSNNTGPIKGLSLKKEKMERET